MNTHCFLFWSDFLNRRYFDILSPVLSFVCFASVLAMIAHALDFISFAHGEKIFIGILVVISGYSAACFRSIGINNVAARKKVIGKRLFLLFIFYIVMLIDFTLIDDGMGRNIFNIFNWNSTAFADYINDSTNLVPFATVRLFINGYSNGKLTLFACFENIIGNFVAFMPLPFFTVCLFRRFNKWYSVFITVLISVLLVELLQFVFLTGASDIDDVILNVSGAMAFYGFLKIKCISKGISKITFGVWETVENKN